VAGEREILDRAAHSRASVVADDEGEIAERELAARAGWIGIETSVGGPEDQQHKLRIK
jgi:hypothetical protein